MMKSTCSLRSQLEITPLTSTEFFLYTPRERNTKSLRGLEVRRGWTHIRVTGPGFKVHNCWACRQGQEGPQQVLGHGLVTVERDLPSAREAKPPQPVSCPSVIHAVFYDNEVDNVSKLESTTCAVFKPKFVQSVAEGLQS